MILAAIAILTIATVANLRYWRLVATRDLRWSLYALRDRLRWEAIEQPRIVGLRAFWMLDESLTRDCAGLEDLSVWTLLPAMVIAKRHPREDALVNEQRRQVDRELARSENAELKKLYKESAELFLRYFLTRHIVLLLLLVVTIVGPFLMLVWFRKVSTQILFENVRLDGSARARHLPGPSPIAAR